MKSIKNIFSVLVTVIAMATTNSQIYAQCGTLVTSSSPTGCAGQYSFAVNATGTNASSVTDVKWYTASTGGSGVAPISKTNPSNGVWVCTFNFTQTTTYYAAAVCGATESSTRVAATFTLTNPPAPIFTWPAGVSPTSNCQSAPVTLTAQNGTGYTWNYSITSTGTQTYLGTGNTKVANQTGYYHLGAYDACGNWKTFSMNFVFYPDLVMGSIIGASAVCNADGTTVYTPNVANASTLLWQIKGAGNTVSNSGVVTWASNFVGTDTLSLTAYGCAGTSQTVKKTITVKPTPSVAISPQTLSICSPASAILTITNPNNVAGTTLSWTASAANIIGEGNGTGGSVNQVLTNTTVVDQTVTYVATAALNGCSSTASSVVTVKPTPSVSATPSAQTICSGLPAVINITNPNAVSGTSLTWTVSATGITGAANGSGTQINQTLTNANNTAKTASYTATASMNGCSSSQTATVIVNPRPTVSVSVASSTICSESNAVFTITNPNTVAGTTFSWTMSGASITGTASGSGASVNQNLINTTNTNKTATYTASASAAGCPSLTNATSVYTVKPMPTLSLSPASQSICSESVAAITITNPNAVSGTALSWTVSAPNITGATSGTGGTISHTLVNGQNVNNTATYTVSATANSCTATQTSPVTVKPRPTVSVSTASASICSQQNATFTVSNPNSVAGTTFSWTVSATGITGASNGTGSSINQTLNNTTNTNKSAVYTVTATANSCGSTTTTSTYTVKPLPTLSTTSSTLSICSENTTTISLSNPNAVAGTVLSWTVSAPSITGASNGTGSTISQALTNTINANATAAYTVSATANSCASTQTVNVTVKPKPTVAAPNKAIFTGQTVSIAITNPNNVSGVTYSWTNTPSNVTGSLPGSGATITQTLTSSGAADGMVNYTITPSANSCTGNPVTAAVNVYKTPAISASQTYVVKSTPVPLTTGESYDSYQWKDNLDQVLATTPVLQVVNPGSYKVTVTRSGATTTTGYLIIGDQLSNINENYIITNTVTIKGIKDPAVVNNLSVSHAQQVVQYFDGLGRPMQQVITQASPGAKDIIQPIAYDEFGRQVINFLPYESTEKNGFFRSNVTGSGAYTGSEHASFYQNANSVAHDDAPYAVTVFEASPLERVLKHGAPGAAWQPGSDVTDFSDKTIKSDFTYNVVADSILNWRYDAATHRVSAKTPSGALRLFATSQLAISKVFDEQNNLVLEYKNRFGQVILKRVQATANQNIINDINFASTYYVYNDFGQLVTVLPPQAVASLKAGYHNANDSTQENFLVKWAFRYKYDAKRRMVEKQVPGAEPVYMIYDNRDRLVLTQDGNQRHEAQKAWIFTKYDELNRPVLSGKYLSENSREVMQLAIDDYYNNLTASTAWFETYTGTGATGYDNKSYPNVSDVSAHYTMSYFDAYDAFNAPLAYAYSGTEITGQSGITTRVFARPVASLVKNLDTNEWLRSVIYYDSIGRVVQTVADHQLGKTKLTNIYDFVGKIVTTKRTYTVSAETISMKETFTYDDSGRPLTAKHLITRNGVAGSEITIVKNEYNAIGQLIDKKLHSTDGTNFKQSVDYRYNIRGWLTNINEADVTSIASGDDIVDYFGMELGYHQQLSPGGATLLYNGNITAAQWSIGGGSATTRESYVYDYDNLHRLKTSVYKSFGASGWTTDNNAYQENISEYDLNGNIIKLQRTGKAGLMIDNLTYGYDGNQLNYVNDTGDAAKGFANGNTGTDDYTYDFNGNLDQDKNKTITTKGDIQYNYMNLPVLVRKNNNEKVKYIYDAAGRKLVQQVYDANGSVIKVTHYIGELIYEGLTPQLKMINHAEGRVVPDGAGWEYQYHLKDHLGNVRVTFTAKTQTTNNFTSNFESTTNTAFGNYSRQQFDLVDHTDAGGTTYQYVQLLNGGVNGRVGLTKSIAVMPGDVISVSAYVKYMNLSGTANMNAFGTALASAFGVSSASTGEQLKIYNGLSSYAGTVAGGDHNNDSESAPKLFATIILFDKDYNVLDATWDQVTTVGEQTSATVKQPPHDLLSASYTAKQVGYAYIFLSNEHTTFIDAYFDDVTVSHTPSQIVSVSDYYAFGLQFNNAEREGAVEQKYLYNGKELQDELNLAWLDYGARMYMPDIGRWGVIDPHVEKYMPVNGYNYTFNNPVNLIDPTGMDTAHPSLENDIKWGSAEVFGLTDQKFTNKRAEARAAAAATSAATSAFVQNAETWLARFMKKNNAMFGGNGDKDEQSNQTNSGNDDTISDKLIWTDKYEKGQNGNIDWFRQTRTHIVDDQKTIVTETFIELEFDGDQITGAKGYQWVNTTVNGQSSNTYTNNPEINQGLRLYIQTAEHEWHPGNIVVNYFRFIIQPSNQKEWYEPMKTKLPSYTTSKHK